MCFHCESIKIRSFSCRLVAPRADLGNDNFGSQFMFESGNDSVFSEVLLQSSLFCSSVKMISHLQNVKPNNYTEAKIYF